MSLDRRHVDVRIAVERPQVVRDERTYLVMGAVGPWEWHELGARYPELVVDTRDAAQSLARRIHLRLARGVDLSGLPGLSGKFPSRLRDAVQLAFAAGVPVIDLVVVCAPGLLPWYLAHPLARTLLEPTLDALQGAVVTFPDASGPPQRGREPAPEASRLASVMMTARAWSEVFATNYQVGVLDLPQASERATFRAMHEMAGTDVALAAWEGDEGTLARHGWRSAAALVSGLLASTALPTDSIVARRIALPGGRPFPPVRGAELGAPAGLYRLDDNVVDAVVPVRLGDDGVGAEVLDEPTLRHPAGSWTLPMLRTAKLLHQRIVITSNIFTFRMANEEQALLLHNALRIAVADLERRGIVQGEQPGSPVLIQAVPFADPAQPALVAQITAYLRPWLKRVRVGLTVRQGQPVAVELA